MSKFKELNAINVNKMTEKKGNLTYLSWAYAWQETMKVCPDMTRTVYESATGNNYHTDGKTAWVKVGITIGGQEHIDYLPIMDARNAALPIEKVTSFDVNKAIQRSTTKAIGLHGLGLYIYAGEDMPDEEKTAKAPSEPAIIELVVGDENWAKVMNYLTANKKKGSKFIIEQLSKKYSISEATRSEINKEVAS
jgi:Protein of unknown function (DUF1071)